MIPELTSDQRMFLAHFVGQFEGCRTEAYQDLIGVWTIGYGHTGEDVHEGLHWSPAECLNVFAKDLELYEKRVAELLEVETTVPQLVAMISLAYNIGVHAFSTSHVRHYHNMSMHQDAANCFTLFDMAGGRVVAGLVKRRNLEADLYLKPTLT